MTNREKIIVAVMLATVAYGANELFFSGTTPAPVRTPSPAGGPGLSDMVAEQAGRLLEKTFSPREIYALNLSRYGFTQDPFLKYESDTLTLDYEEPRRASVFDDFDVAYSGYLIMGEKILAVINGLEYETGDMLDESGLFVLDISPARVVIGWREGDQKVIPITESE